MAKPAMPLCGGVGGCVCGLAGRLMRFGGHSARHFLHPMYAPTPSQNQNHLLAERRVEDAVPAKQLTEAHGAAEHATKGHVLPKDDLLR